MIHKSFWLKSSNSKNKINFIRADSVICHEAHSVLVILEHLLKTHGHCLDVLVVLRRQLITDPVEEELEIAGVHTLLAVRGKFGYDPARLEKK